MTAVGVAYIRAQETLRPDRLFEDPIAATFVERSGWTPPSEMLDDPTDAPDEIKAFWGTIVAYVIVRTRFLDEYAKDAWEAGVRQFVVLGAGLDARAFRLSWPHGTRVFELDMSEMIRFKQDALEESPAKPRCERIVVEADLTEDWFPRLTASGFDAALPTAWMAEGLLIYFTPEQNETLMSAVSAASPPGSRFGMTLARKGGLEVPDMPLEGAGPSGEVRSVPSLWLSEAPDDAAAWLRGHGWDADVFSTRERAVLSVSRWSPYQPNERPTVSISKRESSRVVVAAATSPMMPPTSGTAP